MSNPDDVAPEIRLFGGLRITSKQTGASVSLQPRRAAVLIYLLLQEPRGFHSREAILPLLWPESDRMRARAALRHALHAIREELGPNAIRTRGADQIASGIDPMCCDALRFEQELAAGRFAKALELYTAPLLEGFYVSDAPEFEHWLDLRRAGFQKKAGEAARKVMQSSEAGGRVADGLDAAAQLQRMHPLDEDAATRRIRLLLAAGDRIGAIRAYEEFRRALQTELNAEPSSHLTELVRSARRETRGATAIPELPRAAEPAPRGSWRAVAVGSVAIAFLGLFLLSRSIRSGTPAPVSRSDDVGAQQAFESGEEHFIAGRYGSAVDAFRIATARDTGFARAWYRLSTAAEWLGQPGVAVDAAAHAMANRQRLTAAERDLLVAWNSNILGEYRRALVEFQNYTARFPDDAEAWMRLAELQFHWGPQLGVSSDVVRASFERVLALNPAYAGARIHLARMYARAADTKLDDVVKPLLRAEAGDAERMEATLLLKVASDTAVPLETFVRELAPRPSYNDIASRMPAFTRRMDDAIQILAPMRSPRIPAHQRIHGDILAVLAYAAQSEAALAMENTESVKRWSRPRAVEFATVIATLPRAERNDARLRELDQQMEWWERNSAPIGPTITDALTEGIYPPRVLYLRGLIALTQGELDAAGAQRDRLRLFPSSNPMDYAYARNAAKVLDAEIFLARGDARSAVSALGTPDTEATRQIPSVMSYPMARERYVRGVALARAGLAQEAAVWLESFPDPAGYDVALLPNATLELARVYKVLGKRDASRSAYARFLELAHVSRGALRDTVTAVQREAAALE